MYLVTYDPVAQMSLVPVYLIIWNDTMANIVCNLIAFYSYYWIKLFLNTMQSSKVVFVVRMGRDFAEKMISYKPKQNWKLTKLLLALYLFRERYEHGICVAK